MEAVHNTRAARAAQAISDASAKFHFYQNLSTEIKLMIWDIIHANRWASGAHRFRLTLNPEDPTRLFVQPDKPQKHDASAWRERYALARIDKYSFDSWLRLERHTTLFCTETQRGRRARAERNEISARVGKGDLTTFLYNYGATQASLALLSPSANREVFAGITQIGVETGYMFRRSSRNSKYSPFSCGCDDDRHYWRPCLIGFIQFIRFFKDLQAFYLIGSFPPVYVESTLEYSGLHKSSEIRCKLDAYRYIKEISEEKGLSQFHDRNGIYYEVLEQYSDPSSYWQKINRLKQEWDNYKEANRPGSDSWKDIKFGLLLMCDLRGVTLSGDPQVQRTFGPWY